MIKVTVHLHTVLQVRTPEGLQSKLEFQCQDNLTIAGLIADLKVDYDSDNLLTVVNGKVKELDYVLREGDEIHLIPAISGG